MCTRFYFWILYFVEIPHVISLSGTHMSVVHPKPALVQHRTSQRAVINAMRVQTFIFIYHFLISTTLLRLYQLDFLGKKHIKPHHHVLALNIKRFVCSDCIHRCTHWRSQTANMVPYAWDFSCKCACCNLTTHCTTNSKNPTSNLIRSFRLSSIKKNLILIRFQST